MDIAVGCRLGRMLALALLLTEPAAAATITVTNNLDETTPNNGCSLREAIDNANNNAQTHADCAGGSVDLSLDEIRFNIPGGGVKTIALTADLPTIVNGAGPVSIDGYTQPGASPNTLAVGGNAVLLIELNGGSTHLGLVIDAPGSTVRGLVVNRMSGNGIFVHNTATGTTIAGNYFGTDPTGTIDLGNGGRGVIVDGTSNVTIGGTTPADRNVVSGNQINGVSSGGSGTKIQGNYIGTDRHGTADLGNGTSGVVLSSTGVATVGGTSAGAGNVIAFNDSAGVFVGSLTAGNAILGNAIFSNDGLGIDLVGDGMTPNDAGDADGGSNNRQNFPVLTAATATAGGTTVAGTLDSVAGGNSYRIEFFSNAACNASPPNDFGEGEVFLGFVNVTIPGPGTTIPFTATGLASTAPGRAITATATRNAAPLDTSEFSQCFTAVAEAAQPGPTLTVNTTADDDDGVCGVTHCTLREAINRANALPAANTIEFDIPGSGPRIIAVTGTDLPALTDPDSIDGLSQGDVACPVAALGPMPIQIDGGDARAVGLTINNISSGGFIRGLSITNFTAAGIRSIGNAKTVTCNYLGVQAAIGTDPGSNGNGVGLDLVGASTSHVVGGPNAGDPNVIARNLGNGVQAGGTGGHFLQGNTIRHNGAAGVSVGSGNNGLLSNVIRENDADGVAVTGGTGNLVSQNSIVANGTTAAHLVEPRS